jgi:hypothetical protein
MVGVVMRRAYKDLEFDSLHLHPLKVPCAHIQTPVGSIPGYRKATALENPFSAHLVCLFMGSSVDLALSEN